MNDQGPTRCGDCAHGKVWHQDEGRCYFAHECDCEAWIYGVDPADAVTDIQRVREALDHVGYMVDVFYRTDNLELIPMVRRLKRTARRYLGHMNKLQELNEDAKTWPRPWRDNQ